MVPWFLPKICRAEVPSQSPEEATPSRSEKRKKPRRGRPKCPPKKIENEEPKIGNKEPSVSTDACSPVDLRAHAQQVSLKSDQDCDEQSDDTSLLPGLDDHTALRCLAFVSRSDHGKLAMLGKKYLELVRSPLLFELRRRYGVLEQWVYMFTNDDRGWIAFDPRRNFWMNLPPTNTNPMFMLSDRESLSAGTHLLWLGKEAFDYAIYRYDLVSNRWEKGPPMVNPRCLFASASSGEFAYVAGGFGGEGLHLSVLNTAERYDSRLGRWDPLPPMAIPRQKSSGFYMDNKFFVIGGKDINHQWVTSGEEYDPSKGTWRTIDDMFAPLAAAQTGSFESSPPLVAVANNELYAIEISTNLLKVYEKGSNTWKNLGLIPVRADFHNGWGLAFKALGDELFVIGELGNSAREGISVFSWRARPDAAASDWQLVTARVRGTGTFMFNCAVMNC